MHFRPNEALIVPLWRLAIGIAGVVVALALLVLSYL